MNRKQREEHATLVWGGGDENEGCCDLVARCTIITDRYLDRSLADRIADWKDAYKLSVGIDVNYADDMRSMFDYILDPTLDVPAGLGSNLNEMEVDMVVNTIETLVKEAGGQELARMALEIACGAEECPKLVYGHSPSSARDIVHKRYYNVVYALRYDIGQQAFMPYQDKTDDYGYLSYWSERHLMSINIEALGHKYGASARMFVQNLREKCMEAREFRAHATDIQRSIDLGEITKSVVPGKTILKMQPVEKAASAYYGDPNIAGSPTLAQKLQNYVRQLTDVPSSWLGEDNGEADSGFSIHRDQLPAVVSLRHPAVQEIRFRDFPEPLVDIDPWNNRAGFISEK